MSPTDVNIQIMTAILRLDYFFMNMRTSNFLFWKP